MAAPGITAAPRAAFVTTAGRFPRTLVLFAVVLSCAACAGTPQPAAGPTEAASGASAAATATQGSTVTVPSVEPAKGSPSPSPSLARASAVLITHGPRAHRWVALTFDADMTRGMLADLRAHLVAAWYDPRIVATLRATDTPATIFLTGLWAETYPAVVRSLAADPRFELENHSFDHAAFRAPCYGLPVVTDDSARRAEVADGARVIAGLTGRTPRFFRFPGGCYGRSDLRLVAALGETPVGWEVVSDDAFQPNAGIWVTKLTGSRSARRWPTRRPRAVLGGLSR